MVMCICDGPPHVYTRDWCRAGRNADPPHGPINPNFVGVSERQNYMPRNHGGVGSPPSPPRKVGTEATPDHSMNILDALRKKRETAENVLYLRKMAEEYEAEGLLDEADRLTKIADDLERK